MRVAVSNKVAKVTGIVEKTFKKPGGVKLSQTLLLPETNPSQMLENWLRPIDTNLIDDLDLAEEKLGAKIQRHEERLPSLKHTKVVLVGVGEEEANAVRRALYPMTFPFQKIKVADLGNVRREENSFIVSLVRELLEGGVCPVLIGRHGKFTKAQFQAHQACQHAVSVVEIKERVAFHPNGDESGDFYLNHILQGKNRLFHFSTIGSQSHFVDEAVFRFLEHAHFDYIRLGRAKGDLPATEPYIRDADMVSFHLSALKASDAPGVQTASPSGFFSEEACQLSRYAGMSDKLTSIGFYGFEKSLDPQGRTAQTLAQLIWYFLDGLNNRQRDFPASMEELMEYVVDSKDIDQPLTFWKSNKTGRWWLQVPVKTKKKEQRHRLIPCSYQDYLEASNGDLPDRLVNAFKRFA